MANKRTNEYDNERKTKQFRTLAAWLIRFDRFLRSRSSVLRTHEYLQGRANWNSNSALLMGSEGGVGNRTHSMNPYYGFHRYTIEIHCILYIVRTFYSLYLTFALFVECVPKTRPQKKKKTNISWGTSTSRRIMNDDLVGGLFGAIIWPHSTAIIFNLKDVSHTLCGESVAIEICDWVPNLGPAACNSQVVPLWTARLRSTVYSDERSFT